MKLCEIFASIQGESTLQGVPTVFVRLSGCNLDCAWCDTRYARENGEEIGIDEIVAKVLSYNLSHVCLTGGEPLIQKDTTDLVRTLLDHDLVVSLETNGSIDACRLDSRVIRIIDVKCPGSGEAGSIHPKNITLPRGTDEFKFVLADRNDFEYACNIVSNYALDERCTILFSPVGGKLPFASLADWIVNEFPAARINIQLHRLIWPSDERGR